MMFMDDGIGMQTLFGDGSERKSGFLGSLMGAGKRLLTGESLFMTVFGNEGQGKKRHAVQPRVVLLVVACLGPRQVRTCCIEVDHVC